MSIEDIYYLPFCNNNETPLDQIEITLNFYGAKTGAGRQEISLRGEGASGPWGGDGGSAPHNLIVIDSDDTIHGMCVMYELGHIMNMTPLAGSYKSPPGRTLNHKYAHTGMGGAGSQCAFEIDKATIPKSRMKMENASCFIS